jgi:hypothetical protein
LTFISSIDVASKDTLDDRRFFYHPDNGTAIWDSLYSNSSKTAVVKRYNSDSLLIHELWYTPAIRDSISLEYTRNGDTWVGKSPLFYAQNQGAINAIGTVEVKIKDRRVQEEIIEKRFYNQYTMSTAYSYRRQTFHSDTLMKVAIDSVLGLYSSFDKDSSYSIKHRSGLYEVIRKTRNKRGTFSEDQTEVTIDSNKLDGTRKIQYILDPQQNVFIPLGKTESVKGLRMTNSTSFNWTGNAWQPTYKWILNMYDANCVGMSRAYQYVNGQWQFLSSHTDYYSGKTVFHNRSSQDCIIANPFSPSYPFNCVSLKGNEKYTLYVYNRQGDVCFETSFFPGDIIHSLDALMNGSMYFFIITNGQGSLVSKQKILFQR